MTGTSNTMPMARTDDLVVEVLPPDTVVYDLKTDRAHGLNRTATLVWQHCDGCTSVGRMAALLAKDLNILENEALVWLTLKRLSKRHLLAEPVDTPSEITPRTRREVIRALGVIGVLPVVASIVAPRAAHAQSCSPDCSGQPDCTPCGPSCNRRCCGGRCWGPGRARRRCGC